ncbi:MAG: Ig-like domain-containing protein [Muribaculaceae bacterium]|nr:Ig-like domain-containing protein [Muribaculaceae bacterium]
MNKTNHTTRMLLLLVAMLCASATFSQPFRVNRQQLSIEGGTFAHKAGVSDVNYLYIEDFTIGRGETKTVPVYLHSTVPIWMFQADVVLPDGLTITDASFSAVFNTLACASDFTFGSSEVSAGYRLLAYNTVKQRSLPVSNRLRVFDLTVQASSTLPVEPLTLWVRNFCFVNADNNEGLQGADKSCTVEVAPVLVTSVTLDKTAVELTVGKTTTLHATVLPSDATDKSLTWITSDAAVAQVSGSGVVTATGVGTTTITATARDGSGKKATCQVTVTPLLVTSVTVSPSSLELQVGATVALGVTVLPSNATNKTLAWTSSNSAVATVSSTGVVTARSVGTATIRATATDGSGKSGACQVTVKPILVSSITLDPVNAELPVGGTLAINATVVPSNAADQSLTWRSSNTTVATVSTTGVVTARSKGEATITATAADGGGATATCHITVKPVMVTSVTMAPTMEIEQGSTAQLKATVLPDNATDKTLGWLSSNPDVATVSSNGLVTARAVGTATVTATAQDGSGKSATCTVTVVAQSLAHLSAADLVITSEQIGQVIELPLTLTLPEGGNFTNIEMHFTFPEGLRPIADEDGWCGYGGDDIPRRGRTPVVSFTDNFDNADKWPCYDVVGANITKTAVTTNPCHVYTMLVTAEPGYDNGDREMMVYVKYTTYEDMSYQIGSWDYPLPLCNVRFFTGLIGDVTGNGKVDIDDVNALVNIILDFKTRDDYAGNANVNGDSRNRVDIDDVNALINIILAQ